MDFPTLCRTCLGTESLRPIFLNITDCVSYSTTISVATGIKIEPNDGLPQNMCAACDNCLEWSIDFQKKCKQSEAHLLEIQKILNQSISKSDTKNDKTQKQNIKNRKKTHHKVKDLMLGHKDFEQNKVEIKIELIDNKTSDEQDVTIKLGNKKKKRSLKVKKELCVVKNYLKWDPDEDVEGIDQANLDDEDTPLKFLLDKGIHQDNKTDNKYALVSSEVVDNFKEELSTIIPNKGAKLQRVICQLCQQELSIRSIDAHMARRHPGADERRVKCELCDNFVLKEKLKRHLKMMHGGDGYWCRYCKSEYTTKDELIEHVRMCTAKKKKRRANESARALGECDICHKKMQKASLRLHKNVKHSGLGPVCIHCGRRFGNKIRLGEHHRAKHGYDKLRCTHCDFQTASSVALQNHERRHRGEKPYMCERCGASFHAAYLLAQHKHSHRTEKLVKCDQCPASFKANNGLHMHKTACHGGALYRCSECPRAYSCRLYAVKHLRHVHRIRGPVPPLQRVPTTLVSEERTTRSPER